MKVSKITVGKLYNLGNYEHVRYELTVDVKENESAETAIKGIEKLIVGLAPMCNLGVKTSIDLQRMRAEIEAMKTMPVVDWERRYGHCEGIASEVIQRYQKSYDEELAKTTAANNRAKRARELFDDLGGTAEWKDCKTDWSDDWDDDSQF